MRWAVRITVDGAKGHAFAKAQSVVAGRDDGCDLQVDDDRVSREHCRFVIDPPHLAVRDLGSRNGTRVNGRRITERELVDGDEVRIGRTSLRVAVSPAEFPGYVIEHELGRGAQGAVFLARDTATREQVALKILHDMRPEAAATFLREMENVRALRHPNIVEFRGAGRDPVPFFASTYCAGGSVDRLGRLPAGRAVPIVVGILAALEYAHTAVVPSVRLADGTARSARGLVHRDIKPQNVLLEGGTARLGDFGFAKAFELAGLSGHTRTGALGGSWGFMPRAQVLNYRHAPAFVDVWAGAATLYWMLTGATPRDFPAGADPVAVVLREPAVPIGRRDPTVPSGLAAVIDDVLAESEPVSAEQFRIRLVGEMPSDA